jgi:hypothetical protein
LNPPLSFSNALIQLELLTSQTGNFTFTGDELTQALQEAWNDSYNVKQVTDSSVTFSSGTYSYAMPATVSVVTGIFYKPTSTNPLTEISPEKYQIDAGNIVFIDDIQRWLDDTYTLYIKGRYKNTTSDSLPTTSHVNYVLNLAAENLLNRLLLKKTFVFLTNDTSVAEIVNAIRIFSSRVLTAKQGLLRQFESV